MNKQEQPVTRLFSHLKFDDNKFQHQPGSVFGNTALIVGTTIGAGIIGLPAVTLPSGIVDGIIPDGKVTCGNFTIWDYTIYNPTYYCMAVCFNFRFISCRIDFKCDES
ncbi:MAG: hypothetical protein ACOVOV_11720 [Dolichospermum sp.]